MSVGPGCEGWERSRILICFGVFVVGACVALFRLGDLQLVSTAAALRRSVSFETLHRETPAPRGTIVDRDGTALAEDRPVWEVRAGLVLTAPDTAGIDDGEWRPEDFAAPKDRAASDLALALGRDRQRFGDPVERDRLRVTMRGRIERALDGLWRRGLEAGRSGLPRAVRTDILLARRLDDASALAGLWELDFRQIPKDSPELDADLASARGRYRLEVYAERRYQRRYAAPEVTFGLIGRVRDGHGAVGDDRVPVSGLERLKVLLPRQAGYQGLRMDAGRRAYWTAAGAEPAAPLQLRTSLDLGLMRAADAELESAVEKVRRGYEGAPPEWGALMLVDVADGGVVAAVSWASDEQGHRDPFGAFAPTQRLFEPGSVVKPLHVSMVVDRGLAHWDERVTTGDDGVPRRLIKDDHPRPSFTVREVLSRSSNVGAVKLGLRLGPDGIEDYLRSYRFGTKTALLLPGELGGRRPDDIRRLPPNEQDIYAGPSVLFGYQLHVTTAQVARAFLSFLSGRPRELRLVEALDVDGVVEPREVPDLGAARFLSERAALETRQALVDVVHDGTARHALPELARPIQRGEVAGKTGTSEYTGEAFRWDGERVRASVRTALFAGFAPAEQPRYLVVCVLQKVGAAKFYGGTYAAPAAIRLLLRAVDGERGR